MGKRKWFYNLINIIFLIGAFISLGTIFISKSVDIHKYLKYNMLLFSIIFTICFVFNHSIKMLRFYLILIDEDIKISRFIKIYIKTMFVNILLPFKSGELFRFYCYSNETNNYKAGILSVLVERFFDTLGLMFLLIPIEFYTIHRLTVSTAILLTLIAIMLYMYITFHGFYDYMNRYLIFYTHSKKSVTWLKALENLNEWYLYIEKLISKRVVFILGLSLVAWVVEMAMFYMLLGLMHSAFSLEVFSGYLNSAMVGGDNSLLTIYRVGASVLLAISVILVYLPLKKRRVRDA